MIWMVRSVRFRSSAGKMLPGTVTIKKERLRRRRYRCENDPTGDIAKRAYCRYQSLVLYLLVQRG